MPEPKTLLELAGADLKPADRFAIIARDSEELA
jgi:hypothetical protein